MRNNQNGVSMITLVITIIVMIILAAVAFGSSTRVITQATFGDFKNSVAEVQQFVDLTVGTVYGDMKAARKNVTEQQVRNFVAKGATLLSAESGDDAMLPMALASRLAATHINPATAKQVFENELPKLTVNTASASNVEVAYYLTKSGKVFIWPPYLNEEDGKYYVNQTDFIQSGDAAILSSDTETIIDMFSSTDFVLTVGGDKIHINNRQATNTEGAGNDYTELDVVDVNMGNEQVVFYLDVPHAVAPTGVETLELYSASADNDLIS